MVGEGISDKENITLVNKFYGMYTYISAIRKKKLELDVEDQEKSVEEWVWEKKTVQSEKDRQGCVGPHWLV